jgi:hypothetical protein
MPNIESADDSDSNDSRESPEPSSNSTEHRPKRLELFFRKSRELKLDKDHIFTASFVKPVPIEETFSFDLNKNTKSVNVFMWAIQQQAKAGKQKNLLVGYITLPVNELNVDCWMTSKGETQTTAYFKPLEELKASSIISRFLDFKIQIEIFIFLFFFKLIFVYLSRNPRNHVISDHPGFDPNISVGCLTLHVSHRLHSLSPSANSTSSVTPPPSSSSQANLTVPTISVSDSDEQLKSEAALDEKHLVNSVGRGR